MSNNCLAILNSPLALLDFAPRHRSLPASAGQICPKLRNLYLPGPEFRSVDRHSSLLAASFNYLGLPFILAATVVAPRRFRACTAFTLVIRQLIRQVAGMSHRSLKIIGPRSHSPCFDCSNTRPISFRWPQSPREARALLVSPPRSSGDVHRKPPECLSKIRIPCHAYPQSPDTAHAPGDAGGTGKGEDFFIFPS